METDLPFATWKERLLYFVGRRQAIMVEGSSMEPTLSNDEVVLIDPRAKIRVNDIVLADHPYKKSVRILKRVNEVGADGSYILHGDNGSESTDSRTFGPILAGNILGKAVCRLKTKTD